MFESWLVRASVDLLIILKENSVLHMTTAMSCAHGETLLVVQWSGHIPCDCGVSWFDSI